ncbi:MAG TPA: TonB-dependent receptor [Gammaproteobacteria bacterium]|nr:TonB-dependent receptor [Gammaproteobacteria bacterium]
MTNTSNRRLAAVAAFLFTATASSNPVYSQESRIEEIMVVAEKRDESLQDVSQAITAITELDLETRNINSFVDLSALAPGLTVSKNEGFKTVVSIRGVGNETNQNAVAAPSVAYHMDGIFIASPFSLQSDFIDVERIEVLRGPQGTLFGQNSTGGAINVISKEPSLDSLEGKADVTVGNYGLTKTRASINIPFSDSLASRTSVSLTSRDGFSQNVFNGQELDDADHTSFRTDWLLELSDTSSLRVFGQYFDADNNGAAIKGFYDTTPDRRKLSQNTLSKYQLESKIVGGIGEFDLGYATLKALASWQKDEIYVVRDNDRHNLFHDPSSVAATAPFYVGVEFNPESQIQETNTFEINMISNEPFNGVFDWIIGAFYMDQEIEGHIREFLDDNFNGVYDGTFADPYFDTSYSNMFPASMLPAGLSPGQIPGGAGDWGFMSDNYPTRESYSVYGQTTFNVSDALRIIAGARYTDDTVESYVNNFFGGQIGNLEKTSTKTTGRLAFEYDLGLNSMIYSSFTLGFKPGGSNLTYGYTEAEDASMGNAIAPPLVFPTFESESVTAYEVGIKSDFIDGRMRANVAAFFYQYDDLQFQATDPDVFRGGVANIPGSEMKGAEAEIIGILTDELTLDFKAAILDSEVTTDFETLDNVKANSTIPAPPWCSPVGYLGFCYEDLRYANRENIRGNELAKSPDLTASLRLQHQTGLSSGHTLTSTIDYIHRGSFQQRVINHPLIDTVEDYNLLNLTTGLDSESGTWGFDIMLYNLTDEDGINSAMTDVFGVNATGIELIPPRQIMGRLSYSF